MHSVKLEEVPHIVMWDIEELPMRNDHAHTNRVVIRLGYLKQRTDNE